MDMSNPELTSELAGWLMQRVLFAEWRGLLAAGWLPEPALVEIRSRVAHTGEFADDEDRTLMQRQLDEAYAAVLGVDVADMPGDGLWLVPDDPSGIG